MKRLIGSKSNKPPPKTLEETQQGIEDRVSKVDEKAAQLDKKIRGLHAKMKQCRSPAQKSRYKQQILQLMKQKRMYEQQSMTMANQAFNMEMANFTKNSLEETVETVRTMETTTKQLKKQFKKINIPSIERVQDEMRDLLEDSNEIQEILGESFAMDMDIDEEELDAELEALEAMDEEEIGMDIPSYLQDPTADPLKDEGLTTTDQGEQVTDEYGIAVPMNS